MDLRLNPTTGELDVTDFTSPRLFTVSENLNAIKQRLMIRLKTFLGEWFADSTVGVPWFQQILASRGSNSDETLQILFRNEILKCQGILSVEKISVTKNGREYQVSFTAKTEQGTIVVDNLTPFVNIVSSALTSLSVSLGVLSPSFTAPQLTYTDSIPAGSPFVTITISYAGGATATVNGISVDSGNSINVPLPVLGANVATIEVTGSDVSTYTVTFNKGTNQVFVKASNAEASDSFGRSVASSGNTIVVGAPHEDSNATTVNGNQADNSAASNGAAYVFFFDGTNWTQQAYLKPSVASSQFGCSVAIDGDTIVVGAQNENVSTGAVYVFTRSGTTWTQQQRIVHPNADTSDNFGCAVGVSGDTLIAGAWGEGSNATGINGTETNNSLSSCGAAFVYVRSAGVWTKQAYLKNAIAASSKFFGYAVAINLDTAVVGCFGDDYVSPDSGSATVFTRSGVTWTQQQILTASNPDSSDHFGYSVSVSGDTIAVGAHGEGSSTTGINSTPNNSAASAGAAYVFTRSAGVWSQQAYIKSSNAATGDRFGDSISIVGDLLLVGAPNEDSNATGFGGNQADNSSTSAGAAYLFSRVGTTWSQIAYVKAPHSQTMQFGGNGSYFTNPKGSGVAIGSNFSVVGAMGEASSTTGINPTPNTSAAASGAAFIF